jgi:hypothetical protein
MAHNHSDHHHVRARRRPTLSLFRMSVVGRLGIAIGISAVLWAAIGWALA